MAMRENLSACMHLLSWLLAASWLALAPTLLVGDETGYWSNEAVNLAYSIGTIDKPGTRHLVIDSPDHKKQVVIQNAEFQVLKKGICLDGTSLEGLPTLAELGWSPDSKGFFVTSSDGGDVGTWSIAIYLLNKRQVVRFAPVLDVKNDFINRYNCNVWEDHQENEFPNLAALKWLSGSKELLLIAEVPPHSTCPEMGKFIGYLISIPEGKILERISSQEMKKRWGGSLGPRHRDDEANDATIDKLSPWSTK